MWACWYLVLVVTLVLMIFCGCEMHLIFKWKCIIGRCKHENFNNKLNECDEILNLFLCFNYSFIPLGRRVSCADLGRGTHQGWIYTRKPRKTTWEKTTKWCVLKDANLFIYASQRVSMQNWDHRHSWARITYFWSKNATLRLKIVIWGNRYW